MFILNYNQVTILKTLQTEMVVQCLLYNKPIVHILMKKIYIYNQGGVYFSQRLIPVDWSLKKELGLSQSSLKNDQRQDE